MVHFKGDTTKTLDLETTKETLVVSLQRSALQSDGDDAVWTGDEELRAGNSLVERKASPNFLYSAHQALKRPCLLEVIRTSEKYQYIIYIINCVIP